MGSKNQESKTPHINSFVRSLKLNTQK